MPKSTPINPPIITWLSKCFARNILERPTKQEVIIKNILIALFLMIIITSEVKIK